MRAPKPSTVTNVMLAPVSLDKACRQINRGRVALVSSVHGAAGTAIAD